MFLMIFQMHLAVAVFAGKLLASLYSTVVEELHLTA